MLTVLSLIGVTLVALGFLLIFIDFIIVFDDWIEVVVLGCLCVGAGLLFVAAMIGLWP